MFISNAWQAVTRMGKGKRISVLVALSLMILVLLLVVVLVVRGGSSSCDALDKCEPYKAVCASSGNEHQFFYSHCDMIRENCMTGTNWKRDHFSHCNVNT